jgi:hypothetical protein
MLFCLEWHENQQTNIEDLGRSVRQTAEEKGKQGLGERLSLAWYKQKDGAE